MPADTLKKLHEAESEIRELTHELGNCELAIEGTKARIETQKSKIRALIVLNDTFSVIIETQKSLIRKLEITLESHGFRLCDAPACNCGMYHPPDKVSQ